MKNTGKYLLIVLIASFLTASSLGININTAGVFILPVANQLEVNVSEFSFHVTLITMGVAIGSFFVPILMRYIQFRWLVVAGTIVVAASTFLMGRSNHLIQFYILSFIRGFATALFGIVSVQSLINNWFIDSHGLATSVVLSFAGLTGAILSPILANIINEVSWRNGYYLQAILFLVFNSLAILLPYSYNPEDEGLVPYQKNKTESSNEDDSQKAVRSKPPLQNVRTTFALMLLIAFGATGLTGLYQHLSGIGSDLGFNAVQAAYLLSFCMIGNIVFKLIIGLLSDWKGLTFSTIVISLTILAGLILLWTEINLPLVLLGSFFFGACFSLSSVALSLLTVHLFSPQLFIRIYPIINFTGSVGASLTIFLYGLSFDFTGSYQLALIVSMVMIIGVTILVYYLLERSKIRLNK